MNGKSYLENPVLHAKLTRGMTVAELVEQYRHCAFGAGRLAKAVNIYRKMQVSGVTNFFGLAGAMIPAGMRQILVDMIQRRSIDVLVTTGANIVHDMIEAFGGRHCLGECNIDDLELKNNKIDRIYDVYLSDLHFTTFEERFDAMLEDILDSCNGRQFTICEFLYEAGVRIDDKKSILRATANEGIPVFCPAIADSAIGLQSWIFGYKRNLQVDTFKDIRTIMDICYGAKKSGALFIGGGVPKNFIMQSMLLIPKGFDYAIQLTMDTPETGGLSGATLDEAKSWGKIGENAETVTVYGDATITLPLLVAATL
ncbi:MAG TPA: deoxyhypusine synthase [Candidatus Acidoferrales bacterium]|nr:deoxyhypusine synthase [Candidatus Acidoferrales bacterium]